MMCARGYRVVLCAVLAAVLVVFTAGVSGVGPAKRTVGGDGRGGDAVRGGAGGAGVRGAVARPRLDPGDFRCIVVGDSQTAGPDSGRIRTQFHRWDAPFVGEQLVVGNSSAGFVVNNGNGASGLISYRTRDLNGGWFDGGPNDFFAVLGHEWEVAGDLDIPSNRVGRFRLRFGSGNTDAPWDEAWGIGVPLRAYVAVRTSPNTVPAIELRAERGGVMSPHARSVHELNASWGVQIIEQDIPADFNPLGDDVGIGLFFPSGYVEQAGQRLQVLGVTIERVGVGGRRPRGMMVGYQGRGSWNIEDHINLISTTGRMALIEMTDADHVMVFLGHNQERGGIGNIDPNLCELVEQYEHAYQLLGRPRPRFVLVVPWTIFTHSTNLYQLEYEQALIERAGLVRDDLVVNYLPLHGYTRPDLYDPDRYRLDAARVHPGDIPSAVNLGQDLFEMLFEGRRE